LLRGSKKGLNKPGLCPFVGLGIQFPMNSGVVIAGGKKQRMKKSEKTPLVLLQSLFKINRTFKLT